MSTYEVRKAVFRDVVDTTSPLVLVATGFKFVEGAVWEPHRHYLLFSDIEASTIYRWTTQSGIEVYKRCTNKTNGNTLDRSGRLVSCEHATSRVVRREHDETITVLASHWQDRELNSPNDVIVAKDGQIYFTDPNYGRTHSPRAVPRPQPQSFQGVFRLDPDSRLLTLLADDFDQPNGLALSLDERQLFVSDSPRFHVRRFDLLADGQVSGGEVWAETVGVNDWEPDGLKLDSAGNVYSCGPGGIHVFAPDSVCLGVIQCPEQACNFTWGAPDRRTLFITAMTSVYRITVKIPGLALY
jgi:gluconolactonase